MISEMCFSCCLADERTAPLTSTPYKRPRGKDPTSAWSSASSHERHCTTADEDFFSFGLWSMTTKPERFVAAFGCPKHPDLGAHEQTGQIVARRTVLVMETTASAASLTST